jgi:hypothetical protein
MKTVTHWANLLRGYDDLATLPASVVDAVEGFVKRYRPRELAASLEPIANDLVWCEQRGRALLPMVEDKTFKLEMPLPAPLEAYCPANKAGGYTAIRWADPVRGEFKRLVANIYRQFGAHPAFEGMALQETALGLPAEALDKFKYTPALYAQTYLDIVEAVDTVRAGTTVDLQTDADYLRAVAARHPVVAGELTEAAAYLEDEASQPRRLFWNQNYFSRDGKGTGIERVLIEASDTIALGGPDCWPKSDALVKQVYPRYSDPRFAGRTKFMTISKESHSQTGMTLGQVYDYGIGTLGADHMLWTYIPSLWPACAKLIQERTA